MFKRPARLMATALLVVGALAACTEVPGPTEMSEPLVESSPNVSPYTTQYTLQMAAAYAEETGATLATKESEDFGYVTTAVIGERGGTLRVGDHSLVIPRYAVEEDTWFRMEVVSGANVLVDLSAREVDDDEPVYEFERPLTLTLSYEGLLQAKDPSALRNVYLYLDSPKYMIPLDSKVDEASKTVISLIYHFSQYGMAIE